MLHNTPEEAVDTVVVAVRAVKGSANKLCGDGA